MKTKLLPLLVVLLASAVLQCSSATQKRSYVQPRPDDATIDLDDQPQDDVVEGSGRDDWGSGRAGAEDDEGDDYYEGEEASGVPATPKPEPPKRKEEGDEFFPPDDHPDKEPDNELPNFNPGNPDMTIEDATPDTKGNNLPGMKSHSLGRNTLIAQPGILGGIIGGAIVGLLCAVLLVMFIVYRMRKKDEGSYALNEPKSTSPHMTYSKAPTKEFYA